MYHSECAFILLLLIRLVKFCLEHFVPIFFFFLLRTAKFAVISADAIPNTKYSFIRKKCSVNHYVVECPLFSAPLLRKCRRNRIIILVEYRLSTPLPPLHRFVIGNLCGGTMATLQQMYLALRASELRSFEQCRHHRYHIVAASFSHL